MHNPFLYIILTIVVFTVALNLWLTIRLAKRVATRENDNWKTSDIVRTAISSFDGCRAVNGKRVVVDQLLGNATVLVFLSPACSTCANKVKELEEILPAVESLDIRFWIMSGDNQTDLTDMLAGSPLLQNIMIPDLRTKQALNPNRIVPLYLFIDEKLVVQACDMIGDEDWKIFVMQMKEAA